MICLTVISAGESWFGENGVTMMVWMILLVSLLSWRVLSRETYGGFREATGARLDGLQCNWFLIQSTRLQSIDALVNLIIFWLLHAHACSCAEQLSQLRVLRADLDELLQTDLTVVVRVHPLEDELNLFLLLMRGRVRSKHLVQTLWNRKERVLICEDDDGVQIY